MSKSTLKKEKWTLSFDPVLKKMVIREARRNGTYPVQYLERVVRERLNPFGHTDIPHAVTYIRALRKASRSQSDEAFLQEVREWQRSHSS